MIVAYGIVGLVAACLFAAYGIRTGESTRKAALLGFAVGLGWPIFALGWSIMWLDWRFGRHLD